MIKLFIICLLALTYTSTYAQEHTKQETMDWIASKMVNNGKKSNFEAKTDWALRFCSFTNVSRASNGKIVYSTDDYTYIFRKMNNDRFTNYAILTIDLSDVHSVEVIEKEGIRSMKILGSNIYNFKTYKDKEAIVKNDFIEETASQLLLNVPKYRDDNPENYYEQSLIDFSAEPDLFNRMYKALQTLAKLNNAEKPKEKF